MSRATARSAALLLLLGACSPAVDDEGVYGPALIARVDHAKVDEGQPVELQIRAISPPGWAITAGQPEAEGLKIEDKGAETPTQSGEATVVVHRYTLSGPKGSYVIQPGAGQAKGPGDETRPLEQEPIFIDIGVDGPTGGPMAELEAIPPPEPTPWALIAGIALGLGAIVTAIVLWLRRRRQPPPPEIPDPPHIIALRAWEQARRSGADDHALALRLSTILRAYLEAITGFPATARTTREILRELEHRGRLGPSLRANAAHVLDATDRLKFAREGGGETFFEAMDEDFLAVIQATRPREEAPPAAAPESGQGGPHD